LAKYCPNVVSPQLTQKLETEMSEIQLGKETKQAVLKDAIEILNPVMIKLKEKSQLSVDS